MAEERLDTPEEQSDDDPWGDIAELKKERELGSTPAARAANSALLAMSRAARSFLLYDPSNEAIRTFLEDLKSKFEAFSAEYGDMELDIRPFELVYEGDVIYLERDRERSLAFKMFRDGVRRLSVKGGVTWDELLRLLEILSIRYTGVRQQEDDIVTLLWKAGFKNIEIEAVEGVMPDEEEEIDDAMADGAAREKKSSYGAQIEAPADRDLPLPKFYRAGRLRHRELDQHEIDGLLSEVDARFLAVNALTLAEDMLEVVKNPTDPTTLDDILSYLDEIRDFLLAEEQLGHLSRLVVMLQKTFPDEPELIQPMLRRFSGPEALRRILKSIQKNHSAPPPELLELMAMIPADHLDQCINLLAMERDQTSRRILRHLIEHFTTGREVWFIQRLLEVDDPAVAADMLRCAGRVMPDSVFEFAPELASKTDAELQDELLYHIEAVDHPEVDKALLQLLDSSNEGVRIRTIDAMAVRNDTRAYRNLVDSVNERAFGKLSVREAESIGKAMAILQPNQARVRFVDWVKPRNLIQRWFGRPGQKMLAWTALAGLEIITDEDYDKHIEWLAKRTSDDLYKRCRACLVHRRRNRRDDEEAEV